VGSEMCIRVSFQVAEMSGANDRARRLRDGLLHGTTDPVTARSH